LQVLVHCIAGYSRSASLVVAYLIGHAALTFDEALALVKERRPVAEPNLGFANQLRAFERVIINYKRVSLSPKQIILYLPSIYCTYMYIYS
jgi:protein-tyrosine phosphatase